MMKDGKYVVFKARDVQWRGSDDAPFANGLTPAQVVGDAVVIRTQDVFAGPALWTYAHSIAQVAKLTREVADDAEGEARHALLSRARQLQDTADYFADRAAEASDHDGKLPD